MKQKGNFTPEIKIDIKERKSIPKKGHTELHVQKPPQNCASARGLQEQLDPGAHTMPSVCGLFLSLSSSLSFLSIS